MMRFFAAMIFALVFAASAQAAGFSNWAAIVVAGDYRAHDGSASEVFDNARRDIAASLVRMGFAPGNIEQFSVRPQRYAPLPFHSDMQAISSGLWDLSNRAAGGCFVYITSHGSPDGVLIGDTVASPREISAMVGNACGRAPTVVVLSSCYSGVFVPALAGPNRFVLTAARADRTSFGCGQSNKYTFFDRCFLQSLHGSHDFPGLATRVQFCVAAREKKEQVTLPSDPQLSIGADVADALPHW
jgi:Peptidase C13 family